MYLEQWLDNTAVLWLQRRFFRDWVIHEEWPWFRDIAMALVVTFTFGLAFYHVCTDNLSLGVFHSFIIWSLLLPDQISGQHSAFLLQCIHTHTHTMSPHSSSDTDTCIIFYNILKSVGFFSFFLAFQDFKHFRTKNASEFWRLTQPTGAKHFNWQSRSSRSVQILSYLMNRFVVRWFKISCTKLMFL